MAIGNIIIVDAVLLTHILRSAVVIINPAIILLGLVPEKPSIFKAILLCSPLSSIAEAIMKPPKNKRTNGCAYEVATILISNRSNRGNKIKGIRPVA